MEKESDHLDDFAPELAMVTKFGNEARRQFPNTGSKDIGITRSAEWGPS